MRMSKLGVHVSSGNRKGFGDFLKQCAEAGSPVPVIFAVDQNVWPDTQQFSPETIVIFRHQPRDADGGGLDAPGGMYHTDPITTARTWMNLLMPKWRLNPAHYYAPINEQAAGIIHIAEEELKGRSLTAILLYVDAGIGEMPHQRGIEMIHE